MNYIVVIMCAFASFMPSYAFAHASGASFMATSTPYVIDLGYDPEIFGTDTSTRFDFLLWKGQANTGAVADYDHVWVRVIRNASTLYASGIAHQEVGPTTMLYTFDVAGEYEIETSFRDAQGDTIATAKFPFVVVSSESDYPYALLLSIPLACFAGGLIVFAIMRRKRTTVAA